MLRAAMVLALAGSLVTGASAFGTTRPPKPDDPDDTCNTSEVGPAMDAGWAALFGLGKCRSRDRQIGARAAAAEAQEARGALRARRRGR